MGIIRMGPPSKLLLELKSRYELKDFIETGTYYGNTAAWAASYFDNVSTIEFSHEIYEEALKRHGNIENINFIFDDSRSALKNLCSKLSRPAIFWLDSHWSGGDTYGNHDECPLIEEIHIINMSKFTHFLLIDDGRLFTSPPPRPHRIEQWPEIDKVFEALKSGTHQYYIVIIEDVIISVPEYAKELVSTYCQEVNTKAWIEYGERLNESAIKQGSKLIDQGLKLIVGDLHGRLGRFVSNLIARGKD